VLVDGTDTEVEIELPFVDGHQAPIVEPSSSKRDGTTSRESDVDGEIESQVAGVVVAWLEWFRNADNGPSNDSR
jgi:hypothetical protein